MASYEQLVNQAAQRYGVSPDYLRRLIQYESRGNPNAVSSTGARGLTQFTKGTAKQYGLRNRNDPASNIDAAARLAVDNQRALTKVLGRKPTDDELYLGHLQGQGGASAGFKNPQGRAIDVFGNKAVKANLPQSLRGRMDTLTAKEFQDAHRQNFKGIKAGTVDIGNTPTLENLNPPTKPPPKMDGWRKDILSQLSPTDTENTVARHPDFSEAVKRSLAEQGIQVAGFVPPGLTRGASETRAGANKNVAPKGTIKDVEAERKRAEELRNVPDAETQIGRKGDKVTDEERAAIEDFNFRHEQWLNGNGPHPGPAPSRPEPPTKRGSPIQMSEPKDRPPPGSYKQLDDKIRSATDPAGAVEPRGVVRETPDDNLAAQTDPASSALSEKLAQKARGGRGVAAGVGAAGGAALVGGMSSRGKDPALAAVEEKINGPANNVDAGAADMLRRGKVSSPNDVNIQARQSAMMPIMNEALPAFQEAMKDPQVRQAAQVLTKGVVTAAARRGAMKDDVAKDPAYYQRMASRQTPSGSAADPSDPMYERRMMDAVARDQQGGGIRGPQVMNRGEPPQVAQAVARGVPRQVAQTPQPPTTEQQILQQVGEGTTQSPGPGGNTYTNEAANYQQIPGAYDPTGGVQGIPPRGQMPMDPAIMQLMQFFTQGGGGGATE